MKRKNMKKLEEILDNFQITLTRDKIKILENYAFEVIEKNNIAGLISPNDISLIYERHIVDCLIILKTPFSDIFSNYKKVLDIGSGGGFPSTVLSIIFEKTDFFAAESNRKKYEFLVWIKEKLKLKNFNPLNERITKSHPDKYDIITQRAVSSSLDIIKLALALLKPQGYFVSWLSTRDLERNQKTFNFIYNYSLEGRAMSIGFIRKGEKDAYI